jgi:hypothetical protein
MGAGLGGESAWGLDVRDYVAAKIGRKGCGIIQVSPDNTSSGRVRLISARPVSHKAAMDAIKDRQLNSSVNVIDRILLDALLRSHRRRIQG